MNLLIFFAIFVFCVSFYTVVGSDSERKKKHKQEVRRRREIDVESQDTFGDKRTFSANIDVNGFPEDINKESVSSAQKSSDYDDSDSCLSCPGVDRKGSFTATALKLFWQKDYMGAESCLCHFFKSKQDDNLGKALAVTLKSTPGFRSRIKSQTIPKSDMRSFIRTWDILGPINVGKLELDGDPTFSEINRLAFHQDPVTYLLSLPDNHTVTTEIMSEAKASWKKYTTKPNGQVCIVVLSILDEIV